MRMMKFALLIVLLSQKVSAVANHDLVGRSDGQSGAVVPNATVTVKGQGGFERTTATAEDGSYGIAGLPAGEYAADATAPQLTLPRWEKVSLRTRVQTLNLQLRVAATSVQVTVLANPI
jgi:hypothetical protein